MFMRDLISQIHKFLYYLHIESNSLAILKSSWMCENEALAKYVALQFSEKDNFALKILSYQNTFYGKEK